MISLADLFKKVESVPDFSGHVIDSVNYRNGYGDTPLHIVSVWGDTEAITLLVGNGADINAKGEAGYTPLHFAAEQNRPEAIKLLLSLGAAQITNDDGELAIELAESVNNKEAINAFRQSI